MKHKEMDWTASDGLTLFAQSWEPIGLPEGVICLVHGLGEHSSRYKHWAELLTNSGYAITTFDLRGHGHSGGKRGDTPSFDQFLSDISILLNKTAEIFPETPSFLYGHSLGGMLVLYYLTRNQPKIKGAVATSALLRIMLGQQKTKVAALKILEAIIPKVCLPNGIEQEGLSRDKNVVERYRKDPLVHEHISLRTIKDMMNTIDYIFHNASNIKTPLLLMHGSSDSITYCHGSEDIKDKITTECTLKVWNGFYHELHNEPEKEEVFTYLLDWLNKHK